MKITATQANAILQEAHRVYCIEESVYADVYNADCVIISTGEGYALRIDDTREYVLDNNKLSITDLDGGLTFELFKETPFIPDL